ncbi:MAG: cytidylate kinase-like family protein [Oscillospiraceae bacterium]|nr:cytidylate kinase-like family protein [Oscillospiraceae bacterium]
MKIITISREFASGGREIGKRLADILGFDYYDREIITAIAENKGLDERYVENVLENHGWRTFPLTFHNSMVGVSAVSSISAGLLVEQKKVIEQIAKAGKDFVIVGRNADLVLKEYEPLNIFVCADMQSKIKRCIERSTSEEALTEKEAEKKIKLVDKNRIRTREIISESKWGDRGNYHLTVNTTGWNIKELSQATAEFAKSWFDREK